MNEKNYSFIKKVNLSTMIFYIVLSIVTLMMSVGAFVSGIMLSHFSGELWNFPKYGDDNVVAGYDLIARLFGGGVGVLMAAVMIAVGIIILPMLFLGISMIISGIRCNGVLKVPGMLNLRKIRNSGIYKLVVNSLFLLAFGILCVTELSVFMGVCATTSLIFEVLLIVMLEKIAEMSRSNGYAGPGNISY